MNRLLFLVLLVSAVAGVALARPTRPLRGIRTLFDAGATGNAFFNGQLRDQIRRAGFQITRDRSDADATFTTSGGGTSRGGFAGQMTVRDARNRVIWRASVTRKPDSRVMAFDQLGAKLRAAK